MLPSFKISPKFVAAAALVLSSAGLIPATANDNIAAPSAATSADKKKTVIPAKLPRINYDAVLSEQKFKKIEKILKEESIRTDLKAEELHKAAKAGIDKSVARELAKDALMKAVKDGVAKPAIKNYIKSALTEEALAEAVKEGDAQPHIKDYVTKELAKTPTRIFTPDEYLEYALNGMLQKVSPHDHYYNQKEYKDFRESHSSSFVGLGAQLNTKNGILEVKRPIPGSPAEKAGIKTGDIFKSVNGVNLEGMDPEEAIEKHLRGEPNSLAKVKVLRGGALIDFDIIRQPIKQASVTYKMLEGGIALFRVASFSDSVSQELRYMVAQAKADAQLDPAIVARGGLKGTIIDVMDDPGGDLYESRTMADDFIDKEGLIVSSEGRKPEDSERLTSTMGDIFKGLPMVVLVNEGSASASEIVAAAWQDHGRAKIMGKQTFAKGTVQLVRHLGDGTGLKITTAQFHRPSGASNQLVGVVPNILVDTKNPKYEEYILKATTERTLPHAIPNDEGMEMQRKQTTHVCSPLKPITEAEMEAEEPSEAPDAYKRSPFITCAMDYLLSLDSPRYVPQYSVTVPYVAPAAPKPQ